MRPPARLLPLSVLFGVFSLWVFAQTVLLCAAPLTRSRRAAPVHSNNMLYPREAEDEDNRAKKLLAYLCVNLKCGMFDGEPPKFVT